MSGAAGARSTAVGGARGVAADGARSVEQGQARPADLLVVQARRGTRGQRHFRAVFIHAVGRIVLSVYSALAIQL
jgi:hypothetical protein